MTKLKLLRLKMTGKLRLYYFNDMLCEKGLVSQDEQVEFCQIL